MPQPTTNTSPEALAQAHAIHRQCLVLDAHADIILDPTNSLMLGPDGRSLVAPEKLVAGGVGAVVMCVAVDWAPRQPAYDAAGRAMADEKLAAILAMVSENPETLALATTADEIVAARHTGRTAIVLGFQNARSLQGNVEALDDFYRAGCRVFSLVHMGHNDYCDSSRPIFHGRTASYEPTEEHGGLSALGRAAIERINALRGIVDVSQMSKAATLQTIDLSSTPVIASHSNIRAMSDVARNLSDEEIDRIAETGGVIHIGAFGPSLVELSSTEVRSGIAAVRREYGLAPDYSYPYELYWELADNKQKHAFQMAIMGVIGAGSVADMVRHIDYVVERVGVDHVGIGNDYNHGGGRIGGLGDAGDSLNLTAALVERGYGAADIAKIWGENFMRVFRAVESSGA
ncbi:MAG: membrane dipeptidase [Acidimicrobiales bacterium]